WKTDESPWLPCMEGRTGSVSAVVFYRQAGSSRNGAALEESHDRGTRPADSAAKNDYTDNSIAPERRFARTWENRHDHANRNATFAGRTEKTPPRLAHALQRDHRFHGNADGGGRGRGAGCLSSLAASGQ